VAGPRRVAAWPAVAGTTAAAIALGAVGAALARTAVGPTMLASAFALLAAAGGFALDEPASAVVDVTPAPFGAPAVDRMAALAMPVGAGVLLVLATVWRGGGLTWTGLGLVLVGNVLLGVALAGLGRRRMGEPGRWVAALMVFLPLLPLVVRPLAGRLRLFPDRSASCALSCPHVVSSDAWWLATGVASLLVLAVLFGRGPARWRRRR